MIKLINRGKYEVSVLEEFEHFAQTTTSFLSQIFDALGEPVPPPATEASKPGKFPPAAHRETHESGGSDAIEDLDGSVISSGVVADARLTHNVLKVTDGFTGSTSDFLRADGTFAAPPGGSVPGPHHATHEPGGGDALVNAAWTNLTNLFTQPQKMEGTQGLVYHADRTAPAGQQVWSAGTNGFFYELKACNDSYGPLSTPLALERSGNLTIQGYLNAVGGLNADQIVSGTVADVRLTGNVLRVTGGFPGGTTMFLRADGTFWTPTNVVPSAHHATHEPGGSDALVGAAWTGVSNVYTAIQKHEGPLGIIGQADRAAPAGSQAWGVAGGLVYQIQALNDSYGHVSTPLSLDRTGNLTIQGYLNAVGGLNADQILSGTLADARLTGNVLRVTGGFPGGTATFLRADGTFAAVPPPSILPLAEDLTFSADANIRRTTADGSDTGYLSLCGGGALATSRGASIYISGNENGGIGGSIYCDLGNASAPVFQVRNPALTSILNLTGTGAMSLYGPVTITGSIQNDQLTLDSGAATGGYMAFKRSGGVTLGYVGNAGIVGGGGAGALDDFTVRAASRLVLASDTNGIVAIPVYNTGQTTGTNVYVDASGFLSRFTSSRRHKTDIRSYADPDAALRLRPVAFRSLLSRDEGRENVGLIAEEVALVDPRFALYDGEGQADGLAQMAIMAAMLATMQSLQSRVSALEGHHADV